MSLILLIATLVLSAFGLLVLVMGVLAFRPAVRILARRTRPTARLEEGGVELAGTISSPAPIESLSGLSCVAVKTIVNGLSGDMSDEPTSHGTRTVVRTTPSILVDATGACRVDMDECELQGSSYSSPAIAVRELASIDWIQEHIPPSSTHVKVDEIVIVNGARVLLSGQATREETPAESYRDSPSGWVVFGLSTELLLVAEGREGWLLARTLTVPALVTLIGLGMTGTAASFLWMLWYF